MNCEEYVVEKVKALDDYVKVADEMIRDLKTKLEESNKLFQVLETDTTYFIPRIEKAWNWNERLKKKNLTPELLDKIVEGDEESYQKLLNATFGYIDEDEFAYLVKTFGKNLKLISMYSDKSYHTTDLDEFTHFKTKEDAMAQLHVDILDEIENYNKNYREKFTNED